MSTEQTDFEQACDALRIKIFSSVAHDLKTPLACIIGSLQTLLYMHEKLSPEQRHTLVKTALAETQRLDGSISEMLAKAQP